MALSRRERELVLGRIGAFMEDEFAPVLSRYYARGVAYAGKHPQNINNELRNALTHMSRALVAEDASSAEDELAAAARHVERFKRDCLKVAVLYAGRDAGQMLRTAEREYGRVDPNLALECAALVAKRYAVLVAEVLGDDGAADRWEALLLEIEQLRSKLLQSYRLLDEKKYWLPLLGLRVWRLIKQAWALIGLAIVAMAIWAILVPHQDTFGDAVQARIGAISKAMFPGSRQVHHRAAGLKKGGTQ